MERIRLKSKFRWKEKPKGTFWKSFVSHWIRTFIKFKQFKPQRYLLCWTSLQLKNWRIFALKPTDYSPQNNCSCISRAQSIMFRLIFNVIHWKRYMKECVECSSKANLRLPARKLLWIDSSMDKLRVSLVVLSKFSGSLSLVVLSKIERLNCRSLSDRRRSANKQTRSH